MDNTRMELGIVNWFGGINGKTGRYNDFGFIDCLKGGSAFLHRNSWKSAGTPSPGTVVIFDYTTDKKGVSAESVRRLQEINLNFIEIAQLLTKKNPTASYDSAIQYQIENIFHTECFHKLTEAPCECNEKIIVKFLEAAAASMNIDAYLKLLQIFKITATHEYSLSAVNVKFFQKFQETFIKDFDDLSSFISKNRADFRNAIRDSIFEFATHRLHEIPPSCTAELQKNILSAAVFKKNIDLFKKLLNHFKLDILDEIALLSGDEFIINEFQEEIFHSICESGEIPAIGKFTPPYSLVVALACKGILLHNFDDAQKRKVYRYLSDIHLGQISPPQYLLSELDVISNKRSFIYQANENIRFMTSIFDKNEDFIEIYNNSERLQSNPATFILKNLICLIISNNTVDVIANAIFALIWNELISEKFNFRNPKLDKLFPSCGSIKFKTPKGELEDLSCEAVYWEKESLYLCRGRKCITPQVIPNRNKSFLEFSIYDWLDHYGVNYSSSQPRSQDFPIKLAAYFNRLKEIADHLKCQCCGRTMQPDGKYSRTHYFEKEGDSIVKKEMAAAYRLTVFYCASDNCPEYKSRVYLSHCLNGDCYGLIDSRFLNARCTKNRLICSECGGCCQQHSISNPTGFCHICSNPLKIKNDKSQNYSLPHGECINCKTQIHGRSFKRKFSKLIESEQKAYVGSDYF